LNYLHGFLDSFSTCLFLFADLTDLFVLGENVKVGFFVEVLGGAFSKSDV